MIQRVPPPKPGPRRFTIGEFARMGAAGILGPEERVELLEGEVRVMSPIGPEHGGAVTCLTALLAARVAGRALVSVQNPIVLDDQSQPQPDLAVLRPRPDFYRGAHPGPGDVLLLIEVADATLDSDLNEKVPRYARAGVGEVWVIDLPHGLARQFSDPREGAYRHQAQWRRGETITSTALPELRLRVDDVFAGAVSNS